MNRITKTKEQFTQIHDAECSPLQKGFSYDDCVVKLGQLEDIEDELGIDLITLIKVWNAVLQKEYLWTKYDNELDETDDVVIGDEGGLFYIYFYWDNGKHLVLPLTDYGKTWALTKEELENDN